MALHLFYKFHVDGEKFFDFSDRRNWFTESVFDVSKTTQEKATKKAKIEAGVESSKVLHIGRKSLVNMIQVSKDEKLAMGRWARDAMTLCYEDLPMKGILTAAGYSDGIRSYFLPRAVLEPPLELTQLVFPDLDKWIALQKAGKKFDHSLSAINLMNQLLFLRVVLLQDAVFLKRNDEWKDLELWNDAVFCSEQFKAFEIKLLDASAKAKVPEEALLQHVVPALISHTEAYFRIIVAGQKEINQMGHEIIEKIDRLDIKLQDFLTGKCSLRLSVEHNNINISNPLVASGSNFSSINSNSQTVDFNSDSPQQENVLSTESIDMIPNYSMSRKIETVTDQWREWNEGLGTNPAVKDLEKNYGAKWRSLDKDSRHFNRRKPIIDEILRKVESGGCASTPDAAKELEKYRQDNGLSLRKLGDELFKKIKAQKNEDSAEQ